jgi:hypothetical protein
MTTGTRSRGDRGENAVGYLGTIVLAAGVVSVIVASGIGDTIAGAAGAAGPPPPSPTRSRGEPFKAETYDPDKIQADDEDLIKNATAGASIKQAFEEQGLVRIEYHWNDPNKPGYWDLEKTPPPGVRYINAANDQLSRLHDYTQFMLSKAKDELVSDLWDIPGGVSRDEYVDTALRRYADLVMDRHLLQAELAEEAGHDVSKSYVTYQTDADVAAEQARRRSTNQPPMTEKQELETRKNKFRETMVDELRDGEFQKEVEEIWDRQHTCLLWTDLCWEKKWAL